MTVVSLVLRLIVKGFKVRIMMYLNSDVVVKMVKQPNTEYRIKNKNLSS